VTDPLTYTAAGVAARLGLTQAQFDSSRRRKRLAEAGFPSRLPGMAGLWSAPAVDHWIATNGNTYLPMMQAADDEAGQLARATRALDDRYAAGRAA